MRDRLVAVFASQATLYAVFSGSESRPRIPWNSRYLSRGRLSAGAGVATSSGVVATAEVLAGAGLALAGPALGTDRTGHGDVKAQTSPDTGLTTNTYDSGGNLKTSTDARNAITTFTYDSLNRVKTKAFKIGSTTDQTYTYAYDAGVNGKGRLTGASDASHSMSWVYNAQGRVTSKVQTIGANARTVGYGYTNGLLTTQTNPSGFVLTYGYTNGRVTSISINGTTILNNVLYDPFGPARQWTWGNGAITVRTYDTDGKITQTDSGGFKTYGYDNAFRITTITDTVTPANSWSTLAYDNLDRLTSADKTGTTIGYTFDANGNRLTQTGTTAATYTVAGTNNRLSSVSGGLTRSYTYNTAGSALTTGATIHTYYNSGRMKTGRLTSTGTNTTYLYNALGQRIRKTGGTPGTVVFVYDEAGHLLGEYGSTGTLVQETIWLGDIPVATIRPNGASFEIFYVHTDHLNQPRKVTNTAAVPVVRWTFEPNPFGDGTPNENPAAAGVFKFHLRFPGQYFDIESNLAYNYFRDYDPAVGRYVESDPIGLEGGVSTYGYAGQNPLLFTDPEGLDYWIENAAQTEQKCPEQGCGAHQSVCVGKPGGKSYCQSFGRMSGQGWCFANCRGHVYPDRKSGGPIDPNSYRTSSAADDARIEKEIRKELGKKDRYDFLGFPGNNCRTYSQALFERIDAKYKGTAARPPGTEK
jgi:RHS repeat-associated protein